MINVSGTETTATSSQIAISKDGTRISYRSVGTGPALIVIPGALSLAADYSLLATALAKSFSVHTIERRGRGASGAMGADYSITSECEDVTAVQADTGAHFLFGHSFGGLVAVEAARNNPGLRKIAVYEPGISINHSISTDWIPAADAYLRRSQPRDAFAEFVREAGPAYSKLVPRWWLKIILSRMIRGAEWDKTVALLPAAVIEHRELERLKNSYSNYREVTAEVLLMAGDKIPKIQHQALQILSGTFSKAEIRIFPTLDHFAPNQKPAEIAEALKAFYLA